MSISDHDLHEIERKKASEAGKVLRDWRLKKSMMRQQKNFEERGQLKLSFD